MTLTLRARLAVVWTAVFGVLIFLLGAISYGQLSRWLDADVSVRLDELTDGLHGYLHEEGSTLVVEFDATDNDQAAFVHEATRYYQVYDGAGQLVAENGFAPRGLQLSPADLKTFRREPRTFDITTEYGRLRISNSVITGTHGPYLLQVGVSLSAMDAALRRYRDLLLWRIPVALGVAVAAAWWLSGFALRPLARVAQAARTIDVSSLERRVPVRPVSDELEDVARAFNGILERLQRSVSEMRQFSAALAHELRTPLTALRGEMEMTLRRPLDDEFRRSVASQIEEIDTLKRLIDNILTLARAESGQIPLAFSPVDLGKLTDSLAEQLSPVADAQQLTLRCTAEDGVIVEGDRGWLERMLLNLMDNALKFTPAGGRVDIVVQREGGGGRVEVRDTGIGMARDVAQRAFEHFFRGDPARSSSTGGGSGLGLTLVKWIVDRHRGTVAVSSEPGRGSSFTVTLPGPSGTYSTPV